MATDVLFSAVTGLSLGLVLVSVAFAVIFGVGLDTLLTRISFGLPFSPCFNLGSRGLENGEGCMVTTWPWESNTKMGFSKAGGDVELTSLDSKASDQALVAVRVG